MFEWNPVFNFVMDVKKKYLHKFGKVEYREYEVEENDTIKQITCLEYWIRNLDYPDYVAANEKIKYLELNQRGDISLFDMVNLVQPEMVSTKLPLKIYGMQTMDFSWSVEVL